MTTPGTYIGVDVAKAELVVATATTPLCRVANDRAGHAQLLRRLAGMTVEAVVLESTGVYGHALLAALTQAGVAAAIVQPGRVRSYARSLGVRAKTDPIDAQVIARFAEATKPRLYRSPTPDLQHLRALVERRDQIIEQRKQDQNRLEAMIDPIIAKELRASIKRLIASEKAYTKRIAEHIAQHEALSRLSEALQQESGVGLQTAATVLAHLPELGTLNRQEIAALGGLAPYDQASGTREGKRAIAGGRRRLRRALYMAAITAGRCSPRLSEFYQTLIKRGKPAKVAIIACARKLLVRLNSIAKALQQPKEKPVMTP